MGSLKLLRKLIGRQEVVFLSPLDGKHTEGCFHVEKKNGEHVRTIYWDPEKSLETGTETGRRKLLSSATILIHEAAHADDHCDDPRKSNEKRNTEDMQYSNKADAEIIQGVEQEAARLHGEIIEGEVTRNNHNGKWRDGSGIPQNVGKK